jgi:hypothetical protein
MFQVLTGNENDLSFGRIKFRSCWKQTVIYEVLKARGWVEIERYLQGEAVVSEMFMINRGVVSNCQQQ